MCYYVYFWAEGEKDWVPIKEFKNGPFGLQIHIDSSETLSYEQAQVRCQLLMAKHPRLNFKVDQLR